MSGKTAEQAAEWALRLAEDDVSEAERQGLETWLAADPAHARAFAKASRVLGEARSAMLQDPEETKRLIRRGRRVGPSTAIAGIVVLLIVVAGTFAFDLPVQIAADIVSPRGRTVLYELPDGSRVHLDADSALSEDFGPDSRSVTLLKGEAYFEVRPDPERPFTVRAGAGKVEVLGTAFDVNIIAGEVEVTVTENKVRVTGDAGAAVRVARGKRVSYESDGALGPVRDMPNGFDASLRTGRLIFEDRPLDKVLHEIGRHLPSRLIVTNRNLGQRRVSGSFDLTRPAAAFESFGAVFGLRSVAVGDLVTIVY